MTLQEAVKEAIAEGYYSNRTGLRNQVINKLKENGQKVVLTEISKEIKAQLDSVANKTSGHENTHSTIFN